MKILVDAMGGDNAPDEIIKGALLAASEVDATIVLLGDETIIKNKLGKGKIPENIEIKHTSEVITAEDIPTKAIKTKKDSSMVVGFTMIKEKEGDAFISAGNTGALLTGALLVTGRIKGISRPTLCPTLPSQNGPFVIVDAGANADCKPEYLVQFAKMGSIYSEKTLGIKNPRVGLINIGSENEKGNELTKEVHELLLQETGINFIGNVEGRDLMLGNVDVVVCDGFTGNVILKTLEGCGKALINIFKAEFSKGILGKIGAVLMIPGLLFLLPALKRIKKKIDYTEYGGALFLGIDGGIIKCHGSSKAKEVRHAIKQAYEFVKNQTVESIKEAIK